MKTFGIVVLSLLLFILLAGFGFAFWVNQIVLSPGFITGVINDIDFSQVARDAIEYEQIQNPDEDFPQELTDAIIDTIDEIEPVLKEKTSIVVRDMYDYVLGRANAPDLKETLGDSFMNAQFVEDVLAGIDLSRIVNEAVQAQTTSSGEIEEAIQESLVTTIDAIEPKLKTGVVATSGPIFDYLLGDTQTINLKNTVRQNIINKTLIVEVINNLDIKPILKDMAGAEQGLALPQNITLNSSEVDLIITALEPAVKSSLISVADPLADALLGIRPNFSISIPWTDALSAAKPIVKQAFIRQLPPELATASPAQIDQAFETYWEYARNSLPDSFDLDSITLDEDLTQSIEEALTSAQSGLTEARDGIDEASAQLEENLDKVRPFIGIFRIGFWCLILLILITVAGIVLIHREVRGSTLNLGVVFAVYGVAGLISMLIVRNIISSANFIQRQIEGDMPEYVFDIISSVVQRLTQPIFIFTLVCAVIGIILLVVYFIYPRMRPRTETNQPPQST